MSRHMAFSMDLITNTAKGVADGALETEGKRVFTLDTIPHSGFLGRWNYCRVQEGDNKSAYYLITKKTNATWTLQHAQSWWGKNRKRFLHLQKHIR